MFILFVDAPVILTLPHMLGAANEYRRTVRGLRPDAKKHQTFVDVQHVNIRNVCFWNFVNRN